MIGKTVFSLILFFLPGAALASEDVIYGPEVFTRQSGAPVIQTKVFSAGAQCDRSGTLSVLNGDGTSDKKKRVSSAVVTLNGSSVLTTSEFSKQAAEITVAVPLLTENTLQVELRSKPGAFLTVSVSCEVISVSVPRLFSLPRAEAEALIQGAGLVAGDIFEAYRATFPTGRVIGQDPAPGTQVPWGSPVSLLVVKEPPAGAGEILPGAWEGRWDVHMNFHDSVTNSLAVVEAVSDVICAWDPVGSLLLATMFGESSNLSQAGCTGNASQDSMDLSCSAQAMVDGCPVGGSLQFAARLSGDSFAGKGSWVVNHSCSLPFPSQGQSFTILGTRISGDSGSGCTAPFSSFFQKFMKHPLLPFAEVLR